MPRDTAPAYTRLTQPELRQAEYDDEHRSRLLEIVEPHLADDERAFFAEIEGKGDHLQFAKKTWRREWEFDREWTDAMDDYCRLLEFRLDARLEQRIPHDPSATMPKRAGISAWLSARGD